MRSFPAFSKYETSRNGDATDRRIDVCESDQFGRILKPDYSGRSFWEALLAPLKGVGQLSVLSELKIGENGILVGLDLPESVQNHLMHMGFVPEALVKAVRRAPAGDPTVYAIDGMEIALRVETAKAILVRPAHENNTNFTVETTELIGIAQ